MPTPPGAGAIRASGADVAAGRQLSPEEAASRWRVASQVSQTRKGSFAAFPNWTQFHLEYLAEKPWAVAPQKVCLAE